jgi:hypothetical protein
MDIDFVVPWVDGNDPAWIAQFNQYAPQKRDLTIDISVERYRDGGLLRYWFRAIEKNAPWVRRVFFITNGQKPDWLNLDNEKLCWIKHEDYIPHEYLPVFSANPIEIYIHKIKGLADRFVYFNDDTYLLNPVEKSFFFRKNLPCDYAILCNHRPDFFSHILINDLIEINKYFDKRMVIKKYPLKFFHFKYLLKAGYFLRIPYFPGFVLNHFPQPYLKTTFEAVWNKCDEILVNTSKNRFRNIADVNQYLFRYWQLVTGQFVPLNTIKRKKYINIKIPNMENIEKSIKSKYLKELCLNDQDCPDEFHEKIAGFLKDKFPLKSAFEL